MYVRPSYKDPNYAQRGSGVIDLFLVSVRILTAKEWQFMKIGAVYPQTELQGDPEALRAIGLAVESLLPGKAGLTPSLRGWSTKLAYLRTFSSDRLRHQESLMRPNALAC
jgi:hypothetical protein